MVAYFRVKNLDKFQHYRDRNPPWIKLYMSILDDYEFACLQDASKLHLICIWLLASRFENRLPYDPDWIKAKVHARGPVDLDEIRDAGFIQIINDVEHCEQDASATLASRSESAPPESREQRTEKDISTPDGVEAGPAGPSSCPHQEIIDLYHEVLPMCPRVLDWNKTRQGYLRARWREKAKRQRLDWWRTYFEHVAKSTFLTGRSDGSNGRPPFVADLEWLVRPTNFTKVAEGKYHRD